MTERTLDWWRPIGGIDLLLTSELNRRIVASPFFLNDWAADLSWPIWRRRYWTMVSFRLAYWVLLWFYRRRWYWIEPGDSITSGKFMRRSEWAQKEYFNRHLRPSDERRRLERDRLHAQIDELWDKHPEAVVEMLRRIM